MPPKKKQPFLSRPKSADPLTGSHREAVNYFENIQKETNEKKQISEKEQEYNLIAHIINQIDQKTRHILPNNANVFDHSNILYKKDNKNVAVQTYSKIGNFFDNFLKKEKMYVDTFYKRCPFFDKQWDIPIRSYYTY